MISEQLLTEQLLMATLLILVIITSFFHITSQSSYYSLDISIGNVIKWYCLLRFALRLSCSSFTVHLEKMLQQKTGNNGIRNIFS